MSKSKKIIFILILGIFIIGVLTLMGGVIFYYNSLGSVEKEENGKEINHDANEVHATIIYS